MRRVNSTQKKQYILGLNGLIGIGLAFLLLPNMVKASTIDTTSDVQDILNQNSALVLNNQTTTETIMPLAATITDSGTFGTANWDIDDEGVLTIHAGVLGNGTGNWVTDGKFNDTITKIVCDPGVVANTDSSNLFYGLKNVQTIDVSNLDTSNVTTMSGMFSCMYRSTSTSTESKNSSLTTIIGLTSLDTSKVTKMDKMFKSDRSLSSLDVSGFDTKNVTSMTYMFSEDASLLDLVGLSEWDTGQVQQFTSMFDSLPQTSFTDVENWDMSGALALTNMFKNMKNLTSLDLSKWDTSSVTNIGSLFYNCQRLAHVYGLKELNISNVTDISTLFYYNVANQNIHDIESWDTSKITSMRGVFSSCTNLDYIDLSNWDTSNVTDMSSMFEYTLNLTDIKGITGFNTSKVTNMSSMFFNCNVDLLDLSSFNTSKVTLMSSMFMNSSATNVIGDFDTSNVTRMNSIFSGSAISNFEKIDLNVLNWNVLKCTSFSSAFSKIPITSLDLSNWDVSNATAIDSLFSNDPNLKSVNVSTWNTPKLTNVNSLFSDDKALESLDLSSFDTSKVTDMRSMVSGASNLLELDLSNWDTGKVTNMGSMFANNSKLWKLSLGQKTKFLTIDTGSESSISTAIPTPPSNNTELSDPNSEGQYYSISDRWQVVDYANGGTDHDPGGTLLTSSELNTTTRDSNTTYVWQQQPYGNVSFEVPDLDYGRVSPNQGIVGRQNENWGIAVTNDVFPSQTISSKISVSLESPLTSSDGNSELDDTLVFRGSDGEYVAIGDSPTQVYDGTVKNGSQVITWDDKHGFLMNLHDNNTRMSIYSSTLDWTMVNSI
ncbi:BspA family leucine-rich repeat surface protein [Companilactobacillus allii]|uniref:BspA family leucine-rich repeat surface protein n=1 Tax=Companilactobacillus allii TaxID=1847728 RepID=A0A1P8Q5A0_9LACO|nr:BspA family leucine-rich repeat surface protein [Companilactobacillus allii]APX73032.1 hypothetical protein BTM29_10940 [Companilactobacillus allii]USQ67830.1 BspA family leucine-rich repeat surface protein [Companilactobacillus allii]